MSHPFPVAAGARVERIDELAFPFWMLPPGAFSNNGGRPFARNLQSAAISNRPPMHLNQQTPSYTTRVNKQTEIDLLTESWAWALPSVEMTMGPQRSGRVGFDISSSWSSYDDIYESEQWTLLKRLETQLFICPERDSGAQYKSRAETT